MGTIQITKEFTFDMAHALANYEGKCSHIHGHTYFLSVTVSGKPITGKGGKTGMVMDFSDLKELVKKEVLDTFDHSIVLWEEDSRFNSLSDLPRVHVVPYQPTAENLLLDFVSRLRRNFNDGVVLRCVMLRETPTSCASWHSYENDPAHS